MIIPIVGRSALEFWLTNHRLASSNSFSLDRRNIIQLSEPIILGTDRKFILETANEYHLSKPVHIMSTNPIKSDSDIICCYVPTNKSMNSFLALDSSVYVSSPELSFLQVASSLSIPKLVEMGISLCSSFIINPDSKYLQVPRNPIMSLSSLTEFLKKAENTKGIKNARRAAQYILEGANSPVEVQLAALGALPQLLGGQAAGRFQLNGTIKMTPRAEKLVGTNILHGDLVWEKEKVVVEYDSNLTHLTREQHGQDKRRYAAMTLSGYKVIPITADQIQTFSGLEYIFQMIRDSVGIVYRKERIDKFREQRRDTFYEIMKSDILDM